MDEFRHTFRISKEPTLTHQLVMKEVSNDLYIECETHGTLICVFGRFELTICGSSCLFIDERTINYSSKLGGDK